MIRRVNFCVGRSLLTSAATVLLVAPAIVAFAAEPAPSLSGESLSLDTASSFSGCDPAAASYTFPLTGGASGPYPGRYAATATTSVAGAQRVTQIRFTIDSPRGQVTGSQTLSAPADDKGVCAGFAGGQSLTYTATIGTGNTADHGTSTLAGGPTQFANGFASDVPIPPPTPTPTPPPSPSPTTPEPSTPTPTTPEPSTPTPSTPDPTPSGGPTNEPPTDLVTFMYHVEKTPTGPVGGCTVKGGTTPAPVVITCTDVTGYRHLGNRVTFSGHATVNGAVTTYRIEVVDVAEPGAGHDIFRIETGTGFVGGGELDSGDLDVH